MEDYEEQLIKKYMDNNGNKLPPKLFHYTTQDGLLGILDRAKILATDILYLNDSTEFIHSVDLMKKNEIPRIVKKISNEQVKKVVKLLLDPSKVLSEFQIFVCSFSTDGESLSQFRSYCPDNNGFSIGFDHTELRNRVNSQDFKTFYLLPCFYQKDEKNGMIQELSREVRIGIASYLETNKDDYLDKTIDEYNRKFLLLASILKHESFRDEKEWRLFCFKKHPVAPSEIQFRKGKSMVLPYITIELQGTAKFSPIRQIYVGPTPHKDLSMKSVKLLVQSKQLSCSVDDSKIPYRAW